MTRMTRIEGLVKEREELRAAFDDEGDHPGVLPRRRLFVIVTYPQAQVVFY
jgi:hypothetical protein